uniref:Uncharacterized protein n=1 Tax=Oncorhynchus mykiss TaxID=8022 RepID=A0A8C7NNT1_ONCMY
MMTITQPILHMENKEKPSSILPQPWASDVWGYFMSPINSQEIMSENLEVTYKGEERDFLKNESIQSLRRLLKEVLLADSKPRDEKAF